MTTDSRATDDGAAAPRRPVAVACALIEQDSRLLVAQRPPGKKLALKWEFPGGKIEPGESAAMALARELTEELGLEVEVGRALDPVRHDYGEFAIELWPFVCRVRGGELHAREHVALRWCSLAEIAALDLAAADLPVLQSYAREIARSTDRP